MKRAKKEAKEFLFTETSSLQNILPFDYYPRRSLREKKELTKATDVASE
jgi:hypothetical protein